MKGNVAQAGTNDCSEEQENPEDLMSLPIPDSKGKRGKKHRATVTPLPESAAKLGLTKLLTVPSIMS